MGVGSEVYSAVRKGRKGIGVELKDSYYKQAIRNMEDALTHADNPTGLDFSSKKDKSQAELAL